MTITEIKQALGSWELTLSSETPRSVLDSLTYFGHIAVLPNRVNVAEYGDNLLAAARYVGVYRSHGARDEFTLRGAGMAFWLGDEDDKGDVFETAVTLTGASFAATVAALLPAGGAVTAGTINAVPGTYNGTHQYETPRKALTYAVDLFGAEWRVTNTATLDAGTIAQLYVTTPKAMLVRRDAGRELARVGLPGSMQMERDAEDYTTRVLVLAEGDEVIATGSANVAAVPYNDLHGNDVRLVRLVSEEATSAGNANARAQSLLNLFSSDRKSVALDSSTYDIKGDVAVGDAIDVWDPVAGFTDPSRETYWQGQPINPLALRCVEMTYPVPGEWTVAFRDVNGVWIDLSPYYKGESGDTTIVVGALASGMIDAGGGSIIGRQGTPDSSVPGVPPFTGFSTGSYQPINAADGYVRAAIRAQWGTPLNTDSSVIADGDHYEIRYRVNSNIGYAVTWDELQASYDWDDITGNSWDAPLSKPVEATPEWQTAIVGWGTNAFTLTELTPGVTYELQIRAVDAATPPNQGAWSASSFVTTVGDLIAPSTPAAPTVAGSRIAVQVEHLLGKSTGGTFNLEQDLDHFTVHVGGSASFFPDDTNKAGELIANAAMMAAQIPAVGTFNVEQTTGIWVKIVAVDRAGNRSSASPGAQATALLIDDAHISNLSVSKLTAGTITAQSVLAADLEIGSGGRIKITNGALEVYNDAGIKIVSIGKNANQPQFYGVQVWDHLTGVPVVELGEHRDGVGFCVNSGTYDMMIESGLLKDGDYGFAGVNIFGEMVKFSDLVFGPQVSELIAGVSTVSALYVPLGGGPTVDVVIGDTGRCLVSHGCHMELTVPRSLAINTCGGYMGFEITGATTVGVNEFESVHLSFRYDKTGPVEDTEYDVSGGLGRTVMVEGLTPGLHTFTSKYRATATNSVTFRNRTLVVQPY